MIHVPEEPEVPETQRARGQMRLRYEDVAQDGRTMVEALPHGIGETLWALLLEDHPVSRQIREAGVVPILTRMVVAATEDPISVLRPLDTDARYALAHTVDATGNVDRILLNMWLRVRGVVGKVYGATDRDGEPIEVGRVYLEHVFTRPFAPPGERRVVRLDFAGLPKVPEPRLPWRDATALLSPPTEATALDVEFVDDPVPVVFGLGHTDANQHVNSLAYPRMVEEAVLRRLAALDRPTAMLPRALEIAYRKPFFAGQRARLALRTFALGDQILAIAQIRADGAGAQIRADGAEGSRPHCCIRMRLSP